MITVSIIGFGNVAYHLANAFQKSTEISLQQIWTRTPNNQVEALFKTDFVHHFDELRAVDLYIIAVSDSAIAELSAQLPFSDKLVAHTSGTVAMDELSARNRRAVFYPLQTFSKNKAVDFGSIPICLESENPNDYLLLECVAKSISDKVFAINSVQRKSIHVAAVFVNNFTNHLYQIAEEICAEQNVPFQILQPLIAETANKILTLSPKKAQTGPAARNDLKTINSHLEFLQSGNRKNIYKLITQSIIEDGKKL